MEDPVEGSVKALVEELVEELAHNERNDLKARYQAACGVAALATQRVAWKSYRAIPA